MTLRALPQVARAYVIAGILWAAGAGDATGQACVSIDSIGVELAVADTSVPAYLCRGFGQVFLANDTLVESISIWRPAVPSLVDAFPRHLFITETLADYPGYPDINRLVLDAGSLVRKDPNGKNPVEYRWVFDPPLALPHRGKFFFDVQAEQYDYWLIPAARSNPYADGQAWSTGPVIDCSVPSYPRDSLSPPYVDLIFKVRFCRVGATPALPMTWGRLKVTYR